MTPTLRLVAGGDVDPVNVALVPNYKDIFPALKNQPHNTVDGVHYGIPLGRGANLLAWNKDVVKPAPDSWGVVFDGKSFKGKVTAYDSPIYIADAALVPEVHTAGPRDRQRLRAGRQAVQRRGRPAEETAAGDRRVLGRLHARRRPPSRAATRWWAQSWQYTANLVNADKKAPPVGTCFPRRGPPDGRTRG